VLAGSQLLLPGLDLFLSRKRIRLEHRIDNHGKLASVLVDVIDSALIAFNLGCGVVAVRFRLSCDGKLGHLLRWFIAFGLLSRALDVQDEGMVRRGYVQERVVPVAGTTTIEAVEANIETGRVILSLLSVEKRRGALGEALTIESKH
jgi:hypothetical protein